ncbi:hypothetical protein M0804_009352 [Polistes exclamans]|nr:hypothetical protein M0804_009352 [Polistes exclamans]
MSDVSEQARPDQTRPVLNRTEQNRTEQGNRNSKPQSPDVSDWFRILDYLNPRGVSNGASLYLLFLSIGEKYQPKLLCFFLFFNTTAQVVLGAGVLPWPLFLASTTNTTTRFTIIPRQT